MHQLDQRPAAEITWREVGGRALLLLALLGIFFWPVVIKGRVLVPSDLIFDLDPLWQPLAPPGYTGPSNSLLGDRVTQFYPWRLFLQQSLRQGHLPLWNPANNGGQPFVGNAQSAVFDPLQLITLWLPLAPSVGVTILLRLWVAGLGVYLLGRKLGLQKAGATLAMITFAFSGPLVGWAGYPLASVICWLPLLLWLTEETLAQKRVFNKLGEALLTSLVIGVQFLGGHPETSFIVLLIWGIYLLYRTLLLYGWQWAQLGRIWLGMTVVALLGLLLASIQLFPFLETAMQSVLLNDRLALLDASGALASAQTWVARWFLTWQTWPSLVTALLPNFFGTSLDNSYWYPYGNYIELNSYVGVLPLALALCVTIGQLRRPANAQRNFTFFWAGLAIVTLGIAAHWPLFNALNDLPLLNISVSDRFRLVYALAVALLAGLGLDEMLADEQALLRKVLRCLLLFAGGALLLVSLAYIGFRYRQADLIRAGRAFVEANQNNPYLSNHPLAYFYQLVEVRQARKLALYWPSNLAMYLPVLIALVCWGVYQQTRKNAFQPCLWQSLMLGLTVVDLLFIGMPLNPTLPPAQVFPKPDAIQFLQQDTGLFRISATGLILNPNTNLIFGLADVRGYEPLAPQRYVDILRRLPGFQQVITHFFLMQADAPLFDLLNVKYVLTDQSLTGKWQLVFPPAANAQTPGVKVYQNQTVLPRAFFVYKTQVVDSPAASLARITDPAFAFRESAVLEAQPALALGPQPPVAPDVHLQTYQGDHVAFDVQTATNGLLVLTDTYMPGWHATIDGQTAPLYVADHAFRAVAVPAGRHQVTFSYAPLSFRLGALISGLTLIGVLLGLGLVSKSARRWQP